MSLALALLLMGARETVGVYGGWGAFRDDDPAKCFAIAQPVDPRQRAGFLSIATWPGQNVRGQLHVRLSRPRGGTARVTLSVGDRRFDLVAGDADAWAPDARTDAAIIAAMRSSRSLSIEALGQGGVPFADTYALAGAATAIDAAALACRR